MDGWWMHAPLPAPSLMPVPFLVAFGHHGGHFLMLILGAMPLTPVPFLDAFCHQGKTLYDLEPANTGYVMTPIFGCPYATCLVQFSILWIS